MEINLFLKININKTRELISINCVAFNSPNILYPSIKMMYAFYLLADGVKVESRWYEKNNYVSFNVPSTYKKLTVSIFIRDEKGCQISQNLEVGKAQSIYQCNYDAVGNCISFEKKEREGSYIPFFSLPSPYLDFSIISISDMNKFDWVTLEQNLLEENLLSVKLAANNDAYFIIISSNLDRVFVDADEGESVGISGIYKRKAVVETAKNMPNASFLDEIDPEVGLYEFFHVKDGKANFQTDIFGFGKIFYGGSNSIGIVSNRLHLHKIVMQSLGLNIESNKVAVDTVLFSKDPFFTHQNTLSQTIIKDVSLLRLDQKVTLEDGCCEIIPNELFLNAFKEDTSYDELVIQASKKLIENSGAILNSSEFENIVVDLSGGRDSRLVWGSIINNSLWKKARIYTKDIKGTEDLPVACGIAHLYDAEYYEGDDIEQYPLTIDENIGFWRSYFIGQYHRFAAGTWSNKGRNHSSVTVSGGNGDLYREPWTHDSNRLKLLDKSKTLEGFCHDYVFSVAIPNLYSKHELKEISIKLYEELKDYPGKTIRDKFENHYIFHRNRYHFGLRGFTSYHDRLTWMPLQSIAFLAASRRIGSEDRRKGVAVRDVLIKLDPLLMRLRFEGKADIFDESLPEVLCLPKVEMYEDKTNWESVQSLIQNSLKSRRIGINNLMDWSDLELEFKHQVSLCLNKLYGDSRHLIPSNMHEVFLDAWNANVVYGYNLGSRIFTISDAL